MNDKLRQCASSLISGVVPVIRNYARGFIRLLFFLIGYCPSHHVRMFFYKYIFRINIGKKVVIYYGLEIRKPTQLFIGDGTIIGDNCILDARNRIEIGSNVNFSSQVALWTMQHDPQSESFGCNNQNCQITIGDRAWLSMRCIILPGVTIGEGAVVAAGAVVTKSVPPFTIVGGVPARVIGNRNPNICYDLSHIYLPFL